MTLRTLCAFGTRPEAIKMAPVVAGAAPPTRGFEARLCVTAQHREMLDQVLDLFGLVPDFDLDLMTPGQDLTDVTCAVLRGMRGVLARSRARPGAGARRHHHHLRRHARGLLPADPGGHVEAGLRTGNLLLALARGGEPQLTERAGRAALRPDRAGARQPARRGRGRRRASTSPATP